MRCFEIALAASILCVWSSNIEAAPKRSESLARRFPAALSALQALIDEAEGEGNPLIEPKATHNPLVQPKATHNPLVQPKATHNPLVQPKEDDEISARAVINLGPGETTYITSNNYPNKYPNRHRAKWSIKATDADSTLSIVCSSFDVKQSSDCSKDFLRVSDDSSLKKKYCGSSPISAEGTTQVLKLLFKTNNKGRATGFRCLVSASGTTETAEPANTTPSSTNETSSSEECTSCGTVNRSVRIVGGQATEVNEYPWQVALVVAGTNSVFCGGSVYNDRFVVTAAHCGAAINSYGWDVEVLLGAHDVTGTTSAQQRIAVTQVTNHENYDDNTLDNDIAVLMLESQITLSDQVKPACLPDPSKDYTGYSGTVSGWGTTTEGGNQPNVLQSVQVPIVSNADCLNAYNSGITGNMLCAGYSEGGRDSCQGDSGGPLAVEDGGKWVLVGVVSWGYGCARPDYPGVYARVTEYLSWLSEKTTRGSNTLCEGGEGTPNPVTTAAPVSSSCACGMLNDVNRIVGGNPTQMHEYPWQVAIVGSNSQSPFCGASIIASDWIMTAAHCTPGMTTSNTVVVIGEHNWGTTSETTATDRRAISQIVAHPNYNSNTYNNDIALLRLAEPITFPTDNTIAPACLPPTGELFEQVDATVTGWGTLTSGGQQPYDLHEVTVPTMTNAQCNANYQGAITDNMICAGLAAGGKDSCQGDSGGPMVTAANSADSYKVQIGVVSWGYGCAYPNYPGVYARVNNYNDWISSYISGSETCPAPVM